MRVSANVHKCECESEKEKARVSDIVGESIWMKLSESLSPGVVYFEVSALCDQRRFAPSLWITTLMLQALDDSLTSISDKAVLR